MDTLIFQHVREIDINYKYIVMTVSCLHWDQNDFTLLHLLELQGQFLEDMQLMVKGTVLF